MMLRFGLAMSLVVVLGTRVVSAPCDYPRPELLIDPVSLSRPNVNRQLIILDARPQKQYDEGRVPGAVWVDVAVWGKAFKEGKDAEGWAARIGGLGILPDSKVVVYDNASFKDAARMWWILRYWGVQDVRLLNGNWLGWKKAGLKVEVEKPNPPKPVKFVAKPRSNWLATKGQLLTAIKDKSLQIVDARSNREFCGIEMEKNKRAGTMPGAKNLDWIDLVDKETQRFKSAAQLRKLFQDAGIDLERPTATHCQSGGRASVMSFAMELMGAKSVSNYYASWAEWGNATDTPIVVSKPAKKK